MGVNKQVFASNSERQNFYKLSRQWGGRYRIYHNLPFLHLFNTDNLFERSLFTSKPIIVDDVDRSRLKKTSIDYTLCDENEEPLVCIDFDGLQQGFNVGTTYHTVKPSEPWRKTITELKLRVAHGSDFPYFIVGSTQFEDLSNDFKVTLVDGIIGEVLGGRLGKKRIEETDFNPEDCGWDRSEFDKLDYHTQCEIVSEWADGIDIEARVEISPIYRKFAEFWEATGRPTLSVLYQSSAPQLPFPARFVTCTIQTEHYGTIESKVWLPKFNTPHFEDLLMMTSIVRVLALEKLRKHMKKGNPTIVSKTSKRGDC